MPSTNRLTILVITVDVVGRVNACTGITSGLLSRGHRVVFLTEEAFKGRQAAQGFEEYVYRMELDGSSNQKAEPQNGVKPGEKVANGMLENRIIGPYPPLEKFQNLLKLFVLSPNAGQRIKASNGYIKQAIEAVKPDLIWMDNTYLAPAIYYSGIPWVYQVSTAPTYSIMDETYQIPPGGSGYPSNGDQSTWLPFNQVRREFFYSKSFNDYVEQLGYERYPDEIRIPQTQLVTVYGYPEELNYPLIRHIPGWINLESFNKNPTRESVDLKTLTSAEFIEDTLDGRFSGKLIYLSMGTMGSVDLDLMQRLVRVLSTTPHKYLVSKGPKHDEIQLARNMRGDRYLPQTKILPLVDLVISHGGNNTVAEAFAQGKPMVVLPLFADQYDNAQRLQETGYGIRIDPYQFEDAQLVDAIERLLADEELKERLSAASERILANDKHEQLYELIESKVQAK